MKEEKFFRVLDSFSMNDKKKNEIIEKCRQQKEDKKMLGKRKIIMVVAAALAVFATVGAASGIYTITYHSWSNEWNDWESMPSYEELEKKLGFVPVIEEDIDGFIFSGATVVGNRKEDESDGSSEKFKSIHIEYENSGKRMDIFVWEEKYAEEINADETEVYNGIELNYLKYNNKQVPPGYELTQEDKAREQSGDVVFSYGADEVTESVVQQVIFRYEGLEYDILTDDENVTKADLMAAAYAVIG